MCGANPCEKKSCTWSETHRIECEARSLIRRPSDERKAFYAQVMRLRGQQALNALRAEVNRQWADLSAARDGFGHATQQGLF